MTQLVRHITYTGRLLVQDVSRTDLNDPSQLFSPLSGREVLERFVKLEAYHFDEETDFRKNLFSVPCFWEAMKLSPSVRAIFPRFRTAKISHRDARSMFEAGATICVSGLERTHAPFVRLAERMNRFFGLRDGVEIKSYYSPDGCGLDAHYDPRFVNAVQIFGSKNWKVQMEPMTEFPLDGSPYPMPKSNIQEVEFHLRPGAMLSLPPGAVHQASAEGESLSLNISIEYVGASFADEFGRFVRDYFLRETFARWPVFRGENTVGEPQKHFEYILGQMESELPKVVCEFRELVLDRKVGES